MAWKLHDIPLLRQFVVRYAPQPEGWEFAPRSQTQSAGEIDIRVAVLDAAESQRYFGVPMARRAIQPVWLEIHNRGPQPVRLQAMAIDPNYYSPLEAAAANHFSSVKRLLGFGALAWVYFPLVILLPLKVITAWRANRAMDTLFQASAFRLRPIAPGAVARGFIFTTLDIGNKVVCVKLLTAEGAIELVFDVAVPGLKADYLRHEGGHDRLPMPRVACDIEQLVRLLGEAPRATSNRAGAREGDPVNLCVIGDFAELLSAFGARWDETEVITLDTCWKTARAFLTGREYRYSPVSALYLFGRAQDFALQRTRWSINERLHLRLWATEYDLHGRPVWIGQVSRDIGVRFTWRTWNLTTHRIDSDVDEARDYVLEDLLEAQRVEVAGYIQGPGACEPATPRRNLTGDPYYTDGKLVAVAVSPSRTTPKLVWWS